MYSSSSSSSSSYSYSLALQLFRHVLQVFENKVMTKISGSKKD